MWCLTVDPRSVLIVYSYTVCLWFQSNLNNIIRWFALGIHITSRYGHYVGVKGHLMIDFNCMVEEIFSTFCLNYLICLIFECYVIRLICERNKSLDIFRSSNQLVWEFINIYHLITHRPWIIIGTNSCKQINKANI